MADSAALPLSLPAQRQPSRGNVARAWLQLRRNKAALVGLAIVAVLILAAIFAPILAPYNPYIVSLDDRLQPPGGAHVLGTDELGRDILSRLIYGARIALYVGIVTVALSGVIGITAGLV